MVNSEEYRAMVNRIHVADRLHQHCIEHRLQNIGMLRNQHQILMYLHRCREEDVSQKDIADRFGISGAAVTFALNTLEKSGFIVRSPDAEDGRRNVITLSERGKSVVEETHRECDYVDSIMFMNIGKEELDALAGILDRIRDNLKGMADIK